MLVRRPVARRLPRVGCDWLYRGESDVPAAAPKATGWLRYRDQLRRSQGSMAALVGPDRRRLILSHRDLTGRGDITSAIVTPGSAHLAADANPHNWMLFEDQRAARGSKGEPLRNVDGAVHIRAGP